MNIDVQIKIKGDEGSEFASGWVELERSIKFPVHVRKYFKDEKEKYFVSYPQRKTADGYEGVLYPHDKQTREEIDLAVFEAAKTEMMKEFSVPDITARVTPLNVERGDKPVVIKAMATIQMFGITIKDITVKESARGLFVQMPQHKSGDTYKDTVYGTNKAVQQAIWKAVLDAYDEELRRWEEAVEEQTENFLQDDISETEDSSVSLERRRQDEQMEDSPLPLPADIMQQFR